MVIIKQLQAWMSQPIIMITTLFCLLYATTLPQAVILSEPKNKTEQGWWGSKMDFSLEIRQTNKMNW